MSEGGSGDFHLSYMERLEDAVEVQMQLHARMGTIRRWRRDNWIILVLFLAMTVWDGYRRHTWVPASVWILPPMGVLLLATVRPRLRWAFRRNFRRIRAGAAERLIEMQLEPDCLSCRTDGLEYRLDWSHARSLRVTETAIQIEFEPLASSRIPLRVLAGPADSERWIMELQRLTGLVAVRI